MEEFKISAENFDLEETMTCGQTFCWHRINGELYSDGSEDQGSSEAEDSEESSKPHFYTFKDGKPIVVEEVDGELHVKTEADRETVEKALGLNHDLEEIFDTFPEDENLEKAKKEMWGLRVVQDDFFPCLVSYLCSPQMRIPRIKEMHNKIAKEFGETVEFDGHQLLRFPTLEELSEASEDDLRDLGVGYRAKYIIESMEILNDGFEPEFPEDYEEAREKMKELYGVGDKVADCVLLFSQEQLEAYPIDTWAMKAIKEQYPELHSDDYDELSRNMRDHFGPYSGYAQEYIFHAARNGIIEVDPS
ncbi:MAG: DNA-3-methyladenine glycosylase [Candidatus Nanohalobium sp.]